MIKIMRYILDRGGDVVVEAIPKPEDQPASLTDCFTKVFEHEVDNTNAIYKIVNLSFDEKDWATWNFMQWFVKEQIEEEKLALGLIDQLKIAGGDKATDESLYNLDKTLEKMSDDVPLPQEATAEKPS